MKGVTRLWAAEAGYPHKAWENKRSHTDSISPSLAAEGAMHEYNLCFNSLARFAHCLYGCHVLLVIYMCTQAMRVSNS